MIVSRLVFATILTTVISLSTLTVGLAGAEPRYGGTLVWGIPTEPPNLLGAPPAWLMQQVAQQMYNMLISYDFRTYEWVPELAESWQISPDGLRVSFNLVRNAKWHDGKPFTSADVKFSYENILPEYNFNAKRFMGMVTSIETPDDYSVIFNLKQAFPPMLSPARAFGCQGWGIHPKHLYEGTKVADNPYNTKPVGTGPWKFKDWIKGDQIILVRNENYWKKGLPYLDRIVFKIIPSESSRALAFEKGEVDYLWGTGLSFTSATRIQNDIAQGKLPGKKVWFGPSPGGVNGVMLFNLQGPAALKDVRVRKAIAYAINTDKMNELVWGGAAKTATGPVSSLNSWYYDPNTRQPSYNPATANSLLDEAGYRKGADGIRFSLRITHSVGEFFLPKEAELIRDFLKAVGIDVKLVSLEEATFLDAVFTRWDFDLSLYSQMTGPDPIILEQYYTGSGIQHAAWSNAGGYNNSKVNELLAASTLQIDRTKRGELVKQAAKIIVEDQPTVWLIENPYIHTLNTEFSDELQPGAWEWAAGFGMQRMEGVYWTKAPLPTKTVETKTVEKPVEPTLGPELAYISIAIIALVIVAVSYARIRKRK